MEKIIKKEKKSPKKIREKKKDVLKACEADQTGLFLKLEEYKKQVINRLSELTPILQKVAMADFSENVSIPGKEDEFTELLTSLNLMIDDLRELTGLEEYKKQVIKKLSALAPILQRVSMGEFSENVVVPEKEDEFTELLASISLMIDDLRELAKTQEQIKAEIEKQVKEKTKDLEDSRKALLNILEDTKEAQRIAEEERDKTNAIITGFSDGLLLFNAENKLII